MSRLPRYKSILTDANGRCLAPAAASVTANFAAPNTPTFSVFVGATGPIAVDPGNSRIFVRFGNANNGLTSVAVTTD